MAGGLNSYNLEMNNIYVHESCAENDNRLTWLLSGRMALGPWEGESCCPTPTSGAGQSSGVAYNSPGASTTFIHSFSSFIQIFLDPFGILATALGTELSLMRETENRTASAGGHTHWKVGRGKLER